MLKKILFSLTLGIIATLYFTQNDSWVHDAVGRKLKIALEKAWDCALEFEVESVNIFVPSVTLKNVQCFPAQPVAHGATLPWQWQAKHLTLSSSWITFALSSMVGLHVDVDTAQAHTTAQGDTIPLIHDHVVHMINGAPLDIPVYVQSLSFHTSSVQAEVSEKGTINVIWSSESKNSDGVFKTNAYVHDGSISSLNKQLLNRLQGDVILNFIQTAHGLRNECAIDCVADVLLAPHDARAYALKGSWKTNHGDFTITSSDKKIAVEQLHVEQTEQSFIVDAHAHAPLGVAVSFLSDAEWHKALDGQCALRMHGEIFQEHQKIDGECTVQDITYGSTRLCDSALTTFTYSPAGLEGAISLVREKLGTMQGSWLWNSNDNTSALTMHNKDTIDIPGFSRWMVGGEKFSLNGRIASDGSIECAYKGVARNNLTSARVQSKGKIAWKNGALVCAGNINQSQYDCSIAFNPSIALKKLTYKNAQGLSLLDLHQAEAGSTDFQGVLDLGLLRTLGQHFFAYTMQGEGHIALKGAIEGSRIQIDTALKDGIIRLPQTYNFINACTAHVVCDIAQKTLEINDVRCGLYRGAIACPRMIIKADDAYNVQYAYVPCTFESCLLNIKKDLFALFSGTLAIRKDHNKLAHAQGAFIIERSYVKENVYSQAFQKNIAGFTSLIIDTDKQDMSCDITVETKEPLRVDTAFLEASAKIALHITNTVRQPKISGSIDILSGSLAFPYKPLLITKGSIYFMPDQLFDPLIELVAKNKIKKYNVTLQVTGSLLSHHISLESSPPLTDEQIIALLLVGSQEQSLNIVMPALLMQNLKSVLFDSERSPLRLNDFFKSWLKPFKNINLVPSFSDQTGRGGLRGAIEIEINDRWRAMAQKNFSLSEDTRFEVEYLLSDDVTVRGIRNERKDVAGEVEMRWKFGR